MMFPIITLEVQGMKHSVHVALTEYMLKQSAEIQDAVDRVCTPEHIREIVYKYARDAIDGAIKEEISRFYSYGDGRRAIQEAVQKTLEQRESDTRAMRAET